MPSLLFNIQQVFQVFPLFWPIWVVLTVLFVAGIVLRTRSSAFFRLSSVLFSVFVAVLFGIRAGFLLANPYSEQVLQSNVSVLPLVVRVVDSSVDVAVGNEPKSNTSASVISSGVDYSFAESQYSTEKGENPVSFPALMLSRTTSRNLLTSYWHGVAIELSPSLQQPQYFEMTESSARLDLRKSKAPEIHIRLFYGDMELTLPKTAGAKVFFQGGSEFSGDIAFDRGGPSLVVSDPFGVLAVQGISVERTGAHEFLVRGDSEGVVSLVVTAANSATSVGALELHEVNPHNE